MLNRTSWVQICWLVACLLLLAAAVLAFFVSTEDMSKIALPLGLAMLIVGCINIFINLKKQKKFTDLIGFWRTVWQPPCFRFFYSLTKM